MTGTQSKQEERPTALTDEQVGSFLRNGFVRVETALSTQQHDRIFCVPTGSSSSPVLATTH